MTEAFSDYVDVGNNPAAQAVIAQLVSGDDTPDAGPPPVMALPADGFVRLPVGVEVGDKRITEVEVMELTGLSEERLAKARTSGDPMRFYNVLLEEGVPDTIGGRPAAEVLSKMFVGDREAVLVGIRTATYGEDVELRLFCPTCTEGFDTNLSVHDIPSREMVGDTSFDVPLRKGGKARVRIPDGSDQTAYLSDDSLTDAERNSVLLSRCIETLPSGGMDRVVAGYPSLVRELGIADRQAIITEIDKRQPGPRYTEAVVKHDACGTEVSASIGLMSLFPGL
jgi:hypothetical protein